MAVLLFALAQGALLAFWLGLFPVEALRLGGFPPAAPFFVRWAGLLHATLAVGYALEWLRFRRMSLLVLAKGLTVLFLSITWIADSLSPLLSAALFLEASLVAAAAALHRPAERSRRARARLRLVSQASASVRPAGQR